MAETPADRLKASIERQRIQREAAKDAVAKAGADIETERTASREGTAQE